MGVWTLNMGALCSIGLFDASHIYFLPASIVLLATLGGEDFSSSALSSISSSEEVDSSESAPLSEGSSLSSSSASSSCSDTYWFGPFLSQPAV